MRENHVKGSWKAGRPTYGAWLGIPSAFSAEIVGRQGYDYVCVDMQHGLIDYQTAVNMLQAMRPGNAIPFVRVPANDFATINKLLDAGALGVVIPLVNSAEEAREAVRACRYFPDGDRSFGPTRASFSEGADYFLNANAEVACVPMIETAQAVERIDEIAAVPGVDAVYVGPNDLSLTLGLPPGVDNAGAFEEARLRIAKGCAAAGITAGIHATAALAEKHREAGYQMITITSDIGALLGGALRDLRSVREH